MPVDRLLFRPKQTILFEGDSLTHRRRQPALDQWPWLRLSNNHRSWADISAELFFAWRPELSLTFRNGAVGGSTCRDLADRLEPVARPLQPDWIIATLGANDASRNIPVPEFRDTLRRYREEVTAMGGRVVFLLLGQALPEASASLREHYGRRHPYHEVLRELEAEGAGLDTLDVGEAFYEKADILGQQSEYHRFYADGTHFTHLANLVIAGEFVRACGIFEHGDRADG